MQALKTKWCSKSHNGRHSGKGKEPHVEPRLVVSHFMLGNTYQFTENDWHRTLDLAKDTGLDAFALNLGPEEWQLFQAYSAFAILSTRPPRTRRFKLFLSLDMNVLPSESVIEAEDLIRKVSDILSKEHYLHYQGLPLLSTFGGHTASFGGWGWERFISRLNERIGRKVFFMPAFFLPPADFIALRYVDGCFAWNNAWPLTNSSTDLKEDKPFLKSTKPYMAAVSPLFSTHYGTTGEWAYNKNWIYRSDDLLFPRRFLNLISLPPDQSPSIIQIVSWNDYGESHNIASVLGAEPGSQAWTKGMDHEAFRDMTRYFGGIWRNGGVRMDEVDEEVKVWGWWRIHPAEIVVKDDEVRRPEHADWAQDLLNFVVIIPKNIRDPVLEVSNGERTHLRLLQSGEVNLETISFLPGSVTFSIKSGKSGSVILQGEGRAIVSQGEKYNFNMWTGSWSTKTSE